MKDIILDYEKTIEVNGIPHVIKEKYFYWNSEEGLYVDEIVRKYGNVCIHGFWISYHLLLMNYNYIHKREDGKYGWRDARNLKTSMSVFTHPTLFKSAPFDPSDPERYLSEIREKHNDS